MVMAKPVSWVCHYIAHGGGPEGGGGVGTRPWCWFVCLWRRLLASHHCTFRPSVGPNVIWLCQWSPLGDLSCLTTPGVGCPKDGLLPVLLTRCLQMHTPSPCWVYRLQH